MDVTAWLRGLGLERYAEAFRANDIDAEVLPELTAEDLIGLGVTSTGHRRKLLAALAVLRSGSVPTAGSATPPPPEGERRQVTVLFADLSGYTRLSRELDAEELHALAGRFFDTVDAVVEGYGGAVDRHIGDCVMAVFGAPIAHGNDPERAVRAALDIQRRVPALADARGRPLGVHIGIASGQVVASGTGSTRHREYTVTGESVNLASRLTDEAQAGEILISDAVHRALAARLECTAVGALAVKGFTEPVRAWRLLGLREGPEAGYRPFVGRRGELRQFRALLAACRESGCGRAVYVRGEAGIGKTRLVEEFQAAARGAGFACHAGLVLDFGAGTGQDAIRSIVRSLIGVQEAGDRAAIGAAAERAIAEGLVAADRRVFLNDLLDLAQPAALRAFYDAMDSAARSRGKRATVAGLVARASTERPLLLVVEDIHWADNPTLDHTATLTETAAVHPVVLVVTSRNEGDPLDRAWRLRIGNGALLTIDLGPLRPREAAALASAYCDASTEFARRCVERAAGNPLFLEQLLRHAEESTEAGVPGSVQSLVQARMDRLLPEDKRALQAASVLGQRFDLGALSALLERPGYDAARLARDLLVRPSGGGFLFAHALIRDGVYDSLLRTRRRELHQRAARWFAGRDPVLHAEHLERAEDPGAAAAYLDAARAQAATYQTESALELVNRGLALSRGDAERYPFHHLCAELLRDAGRPKESLEPCRQALAFAGTEVERCRALIGMAAAHRLTGGYDDAMAVLNEAEPIVRRLRLTREAAQVHYYRGGLCFARGDITGCREQHELALEEARRAGDPEWEARALSGLGDAHYAHGRMRSALTAFYRCLDLCEAQGFGRIAAANRLMVGNARVYLGEFREALREMTDAVANAVQVGDRHAEMNARQLAGLVLDLLGRVEEASAELEAALIQARRLGARRFESFILLGLARLRLVRDERGEAMRMLEEALAICRETGLGFSGPRVLATMALVADDEVARARALAEGEGILRRGCIASNHVWFYADAIESALQVGDWETADRYADALAAYTRPEPLPISDFIIARGRALSEHGRGKRGATTVAALRRLRDEADAMGFRRAMPALEQALAAVQAPSPEPAWSSA